VPEVDVPVILSPEGLSLATKVARPEMEDASGGSGGPGSAVHSFTTTQWSLILKAEDTRDPDCQTALERLCGTYWYPVYTYIRCRGYDQAAAEDLTQEFFTQLLEKQLLKAADPQKGRFRSFLLTSVKNFLANRWHREQALKRGGGKQSFPLDWSKFENRRFEPVEEETPETVFEQRWAAATVAQVLERLREEEAKRGSLRRLEHLQGFLTGELEGTGQSRIAEDLGMSVGAVRVAVHRLRKRFGRLLREQIAQTVADPDQVDDEIRYLLNNLGS
jgi:RNA polymerase sigma-70 factor (ECF subfamily)